MYLCLFLAFYFYILCSRVRKCSIFKCLMTCGQGLHCAIRRRLGIFQWRIKSLRTGDTYINTCKWTGSPLVQTMVCRLLDVNPLPEPITIYWPVWTKVKFQPKHLFKKKLHLEVLFLNDRTTVTLTNCGQVTPYGDIDLGQHWLRLMVCCLAALSHCLNQFRLITSDLFTKEVNSRLAKRPLVFNGRLANAG